ncbi:outer dynein arm-docking complex subunit 3 isoform X1 [Gopherus flavomarginatus]|uniref:outer dynein arm-docking complex subunit 3 isoform X1 n=1 Tax=Gopherus flavomarginatus TaxID=286002 RepID=UPI0021CC1DD8|nr:outer dynein arm-docking complex subunit 3 isoform X1 [Gopherus flavomarginatus]XP_050780986.1 outer dynein arm-docking complex subunit 3 isoform X1 [Gopherus flavomarginatus]
MPATLGPAGVKPPVHEQISELQNKIQLLEGDRKAFYESSQWTIKKNKESIQCLRQENKQLHKKLAAILAGDAQIIKEVFRDRAAEKASLKNKSGEGAIEVINHRLCEKINRLNDLKHQVEVRKRRLEELQLQYDSKVQEARGSQAVVEEGDAEAAKTLRRLENQLEKARLKVEEAEHVTGLYRQLKAHMQEESLTAQTQLDTLEAEILRLHHELHGLQAMNTEAQATRDAAREQLQLQEDSVYRDRQMWELKLMALKKQAEERRAHNERAERRALRERLPLQTEELLSDAQRSKGTGLRAKQLLGTAAAVEETFEKIKVATGVTNSRDVVRRFLAQGDTFQQLEQLTTKNEEALVHLREEEEALQAELQGLTYSGEARVMGAQRLLEELQAHLRQEEMQRDTAKRQLDKVTRVLLVAKAGVEHLASKVQHIWLESGRFAGAPPDKAAGDYVLELLAETEEKLLQVLAELSDHDQRELLQKITEEEFYANLEGRLPSANVRVKLPVSQKQDMYYEEEASGDEGDVVTRAALKRQSQQLIEARTKRRSRPKKKEAKP